MVFSVTLAMVKMYQVQNVYIVDIYFEDVDLYNIQKITAKFASTYL